MLDYDVLQIIGTTSGKFVSILGKIINVLTNINQDLRFGYEYTWKKRF